MRFTTTTTLPTGLAINTTYYLIKVSATTARVATSLANAEAAVAIAYTDAGTGVHTMEYVNQYLKFALEGQVDGTSIGPGGAQFLWNSTRIHTGAAASMTTTGANDLGSATSRKATSNGTTSL